MPLQRTPLQPRRVRVRRFAFAWLNNCQVRGK
jgi:hypothetical protein